MKRLEITHNLNGLDDLWYLCLVGDSDPAEGRRDSQVIKCSVHRHEAKEWCEIPGITIINDPRKAALCKCCGQPLQEK